MQGDLVTHVGGSSGTQPTGFNVPQPSIIRTRPLQPDAFVRNTPQPPADTSEASTDQFEKKQSPDIEFSTVTALTEFTKGLFSLPLMMIKNPLAALPMLAAGIAGVAAFGSAASIVFSTIGLGMGALQGVKFLQKMVSAENGLDRAKAFKNLGEFTSAFGLVGLLGKFDLRNMMTKTGYSSSEIAEAQNFGFFKTIQHTVLKTKTALEHSGKMVKDGSAWKFNQLPEAFGWAKAESKIKAPPKEITPLPKPAEPVSQPAKIEPTIVLDPLLEGVSKNVYEKFVVKGPERFSVKPPKQRLKEIEALSAEEKPAALKAHDRLVKLEEKALNKAKTIKMGIVGRNPEKEAETLHNLIEADLAVLKDAPLKPSVAPKAPAPEVLRDELKVLGAEKDKALSLLDKMKGMDKKQRTLYIQKLEAQHRPIAYRVDDLLSAHHENCLELNTYTSGHHYAGAHSQKDLNRNKYAQLVSKDIEQLKALDVKSKPFHPDSLPQAFEITEPQLCIELARKSPADRLATLQTFSGEKRVQADQFLEVLKKWDTEAAAISDFKTLDKSQLAEFAQLAPEKRLEKIFSLADAAEQSKAYSVHYFLEKSLKHAEEHASKQYPYWWGARNRSRASYAKYVHLVESQSGYKIPAPGTLSRFGTRVRDSLTNRGTIATAAVSGIAVGTVSPYAIFALPVAVFYRLVRGAK